jgi:hypothetical protein
MVLDRLRLKFGESIHFRFKGMYSKFLIQIGDLIFDMNQDFKKRIASWNLESDWVSVEMPEWYPESNSRDLILRATWADLWSFRFSVETFRGINELNHDIHAHLHTNETQRVLLGWMVKSATEFRKDRKNTVLFGGYYDIANNQWNGLLIDQTNTIMNGVFIATKELHREIVCFNFRLETNVYGAHCVNDSGNKILSTNAVKLKSMKDELLAQRADHKTYEVGFRKQLRGKNEVIDWGYEGDRIYKVRVNFNDGTTFGWTHGNFNFSNN